MLKFTDSYRFSDLPFANEVYIRAAASAFKKMIDDPWFTRTWGYTALLEAVRLTDEAEKITQKAIDQMAGINNNQDMIAEVRRIRMVETAAAARAAVDAKITEAQAMLERYGKDAVAGAFPKLPKSSDRQLQVAELEAVKNDIRLRLDPVADLHLEERFRTLVGWYAERGNKDALFLLTGEWVEGYFDARLLALPVASRWVAYSPHASDSEKWSADMARQCGNLDLIPNGQRGITDYDGTIVETVSIVGRGLNFALQV